VQGVWLAGSSSAFAGFWGRAAADEGGLQGAGGMRRRVM
jgi:hypothetical protein